MKKIIVMGIVAMMVMGMGVAANAFTLGASAKDTSGGHFMTALQFGDASDSLAAVGNPTDGTAQMGILLSGVLEQKCLQKTTPVSLATGYSIYLWGNNYSATSGVANVKFYIQSIGNGTNLGSVLSGNYELMHGATQVWTGAVDAAKTTEANPWISFQWNITNTPTPITGADTFVLRQVGQVVTPEPGSMVAMFSGLVGLVGFGIRRRK